MPPEGNELASGSPLMSSLPLNSRMARPSPVGTRKLAVFLGGQAGHRLELVRVVGSALFDGPILHRIGDGVGDGRVERRAELDRLLQGFEDRLRQPRALHGLAEDVVAEQFLDVGFLEVDALELMFRALAIRAPVASCRVLTLLITCNGPWSVVSCPLSEANRHRAGEVA